MQYDPSGPLPSGERNALLVFFSKENAELKAQVANQQQTIEVLQDRLKNCNHHQQTNNDHGSSITHLI